MRISAWSSDVCSSDLRAPARVHGGFLELLGRHLAEALEAAHLDLAAALEVLRDEAVLLGVVHGIDAVAALGEAVERRLRQIEPAAFDEARHLALEEGDQQIGRASCRERVCQYV